MKKIVLLFLIIIALSSCTTLPGADYIREEGIIGIVRANQDVDVVELINEERKTKGLPALETNNTLQEAALTRAQEFNKTYSMESPDGSPWMSFLEENGIESLIAVQQIINGSSSGNLVFDQLVSDDSREKLVLAPHLTSIGVANYQDTWAFIFLQDFSLQGLLETQEKIVSYVNVERKQRGLQPLQMDTELNNAAQIRAHEMIELYSHTRPNGTNCFTLLDEMGIDYMISGENIAFGQASAYEVMTGWMNSPGHRENILTPEFTHIGVGAYNGNWVQLFIER